MKNFSLKNPSYHPTSNQTDRQTEGQRGRLNNYNATDPECGENFFLSVVKVETGTTVSNFVAVVVAVVASAVSLLFSLLFFFSVVKPNPVYELAYCCLHLSSASLTSAKHANQFHAFPRSSLLAFQTSHHQAVCEMNIEVVVVDKMKEKRGISSDDDYDGKEERKRERKRDKYN
ncbi:hypothetical protein T4A_9853 [Trichinella pseudospiralis]|uniref:Transmembrane protein n=1 Tax=Trichinella pseudospiralis TaxID=6337 RepID=A0A0V1EJT9_TRIPS|nr:hypothetical protein T4A_9853 [Trichinella pseudospiralis]KRZ42809.1 hypothetical protein T4C_11975 [Trichinella pseudospiralis]